MKEPVTEITEHGQVGFVWEIPKGGRPPNLDSTCFRGDLELTEDRDIRVRLLEEDIQQTLNVQHHPVPAALLAMTPEGLVALHSIAHRSSNRGRMGPRASTRTYRCRTMVGLPDIEGVAAELKPRQMSAVFAGRRVAEWAGQLALTENHTLDAGRVKEVEIRLHNTPSEMAALGGGLDLESSAYWGVQSKGVDEVIAVGWELTTRGVNRPQRPAALLMPLWRTQELLSVAFDGLVAASIGRARYVLNEELKTLWDASLMTHEPQVQPSELMTPSFTLADLGGLAAVRRWVRLCVDHPRAVKPVIAKVRYSATSAETRLMEVVAAIHYWVNAHARKAQWANKASYATQEEALARHVGAAFQEVVGDIDVWATEVRETNNNLKHEPTFQPDPQRLALLMWSADLLLESALLHRVGRGKLAGNRHLRDARKRQTSARLRSVLGT